MNKNISETNQLHNKSLSRAPQKMRCVIAFVFKKWNIISISKMMYRCQRCDYSSTRRYDLRRHERRKIPCVSKQAEAPSIVETQNRFSTGQNVSPTGQNVSPTGQNVSPSEQNVSPTGQNVSPSEQNVSPSEQNVFQCERCKKAFSSIKSLKRHNISCKGVDALTRVKGG